MARVPMRASTSTRGCRRSRTRMARPSSARRGSPCPRHGRRWPPTSWPRSTSGSRACRRPARTGRRCSTRTGGPCSEGSGMPARSSIGWPAPGRIGGTRTATSTPRPMPGPSTTRSATCSPPRWRRRTRRNGSTRGCTGPMASRARPRATTTSSPTPACSPAPPPPTSARNRARASSSPWRTIW